MRTKIIIHYIYLYLLNERIKVSTLLETFIYISCEYFVQYEDKGPCAPIHGTLVILSSLSGHLLPPKDEGAGQHHHQGAWLLQTGRYQGEIEARGTE